MNHLKFHKNSVHIKEIFKIIHFYFSNQSLTPRKIFITYQGQRRFWAFEREPMALLSLYRCQVALIEKWTFSFFFFASYKEIRYQMELWLLDSLLDLSSWKKAWFCFGWDPYQIYVFKPWAKLRSFGRLSQCKDRKFDFFRIRTQNFDLLNLMSSIKT